MKTLIKNAHVISPDVDLKKANVLIEKGKIKLVTTDEVPFKGVDTVVDLRGKYLVPGFIDVHLHGASGFDVCDATPEAIEKIAEAKLAEGCTSFLPTTLTVANKTLKAAAKAVAAYKKDERFAKVIGIHLEGPFINPACCGAQNPAFVRKPNIKEVLAISAISPVKLVSFAPEMLGGAEFAAACFENGIVPSCGHTGSTLAEFLPAYEKGLRHFTHFCNQMTKLHHREIGMVGAGFLLDDINTEVICDRIHLCDDMLRLVFWKRDLAHVQMITDSLRCSHCPDGYEFEMGGLKVALKNGEARLVEGGNLAGSTLWLNKGLKNLVEVTGLPLKDLIRVTSWNQAIELGLGKKLGKVEKGFLADLAVLDPKTFDVCAVFVEGEQRI
ncbi:MAG: N-acetylglucosamine-6-phosphate deacetylase [Kiritimatiellae bacterium]|nr:N-acetylglucosamine-6-phosphate deacetylase [Kiritimatiellia bacterium]